MKKNFIILGLLKYFKFSHPERSRGANFIQKLGSMEFTPPYGSAPEAPPPLAETSLTMTAGPTVTANFIFQKSHLAISLLFLFVFVGVSSAQIDEQTIRKVLNDQVEAWNRGDVEGYMKGYWNSDSTVFNSGGTLTRGYSNVLARYKKSYATREKMGTLEFTDLALRQLSPTAVVAMGVWKLRRATDTPWGRFTLIIEKKPEGWRITHDHTSSAEK